MITDVFIKRYQHVCFTYREVPDLYVRLFRQAGAIVFVDLWPLISKGENLCAHVHDKLAREIGCGLYREADTYSKRVKGCLSEGYDLRNDLHGDCNFFIKVRFSLIELLFREIGQDFGAGKANRPHVANSSAKRFSWKPVRLKRTEEQVERVAFKNAQTELNYRLSEASVPLHYHNGFLQFREDAMTTSSSLKNPNLKKPLLRLGRMDQI